MLSKTTIRLMLAVWMLFQMALLLDVVVRLMNPHA
jgi:hypothetical protein